MNRLTIPALFLCITILFLAACDSLQPPTTEPGPTDTIVPPETSLPVQTVVPIAGTSTAPVSVPAPNTMAAAPTISPEAGATGTNVPVIVFPPISLVSPAPGQSGPTPPPGAPFNGKISISPTQGAVSSAVVQITVKGSGFPPGNAVDVSALPEATAGQPAQGYDLGQVTPGPDGSFQTTIVMPSDIPDIAQAKTIQIIAAVNDGSGAASAEFVNTDASAATGATVDYVNPVYGFRVTIPPGWRARQPVDRTDFLALYDSAVGAKEGAEPIVVRVLVSPASIGGNPVQGIGLEEFARTAYPVEFAATGATLKSLQPLKPASGLLAFQAVWTAGGRDTVVSYFDYDRTVNGKYSRAVEVTYNPSAKEDAAHNSIVGLLAVVQPDQGANASTAQSAVEKFMQAFASGNTAQAQGYLSTELKQKLGAGQTSLPALLGVQSAPQRFTVEQAASFTYAETSQATAKGVMAYPNASLPVEFQLSNAGGGWTIDQVIPLQ